MWHVFGRSFFYPSKVFILWLCGGMKQRMKITLLRVLRGLLKRGGTTVVVVALIRWQHSCNMYALNYGHKCLIVSIFHGKDHKVHFQQTIIWYLGNGTCHENERTKLFYFYHITTKSYLKDQLHCGMQNSILSEFVQSSLDHICWIILTLRGLKCIEKLIHLSYFSAF